MCHQMCPNFDDFFFCSVSVSIFILNEEKVFSLPNLKREQTDSIPTNYCRSMQNDVLGSKK